MVTKDKKRVVVKEEGTSLVSTFVFDHNYSLEAFEYRLNGEDPNVFYPFIKVAVGKDSKHRVGLWVGNKSVLILLKNTDLIRYRRIR